MQIAGVLVHARPEWVDRVAVSLGTLPGVEIHARLESSRFVVTVEEEPGSFISETLIRLQNVQGVMSAAMVYQHSEEDEPPQQQAE